MKALWVVVLLIAMSSIAIAADTCFTVLNSPTADKYYWKAVSYDLITTGMDPLGKTQGTATASSLGLGYQYNIRVDKDCFDKYLLSHRMLTGSASSSMFLEKRGDDLYSADTLAGAVYTISKTADTGSSVNLVSSIKTGTIGGVNYLQKPVISTTEYTSLKQNLCNPANKISDQMYKVMDVVGARLQPGDISCSGYSGAIDCSLKLGKGNSLHYATISALLGRECGVPTRVVKGISEATFDAIDMKFKSDKIHYWVEYYDGRWYMIDVSEQTPSSPSGIEFSCVDTEDNDNDGLQDCLDDDCKHLTICQGAYPTTTKFNNQYSTNLATLPNAYNIDTLMLGNTLGQVTWKDQSLDLRNINIDSAVNIQQNMVSVSNVPALNKPAEVTIRNLNFATGKVMKDGVACTSCQLVEYKLGTAVFKIPGLGSYSIADGAMQNQTLDNGTYLPPVPQDLANKTDWISKITSWVKPTWTKFWGYSWQTKGIIIGGIIVLIWFFRRRP